MVLVDEVLKSEEKLMSFFKRKLAELGGDQEVLITGAIEEAKHHAEEALRRLVRDEKRDRLFSNSVKNHAARLNAATAQPPSITTSSSSSWRSSTIFRSSSSSSSVFVPMPEVAEFADDTELIEELEIEGMKITKSIDAMGQSLEKIKSRLGEKYL